MDRTLKGGRLTVEVDPAKPAKGGIGLIGYVYPEGFRSGKPLAIVFHDNSAGPSIPSIRVEFAKPVEQFNSAEARKLARLLNRAAKAADPRPPKPVKGPKMDTSGGRGRIGQIS